MHLKQKDFARIRFSLNLKRYSQIEQHDLEILSIWYLQIENDN